VDAIERKVKCSREFADALAQRLRGRLFKVVLFGSVAKGLGDMDSDVDVLVVVDRVTDNVRRTVADVAFEVSAKSGEPIEYVIMSLEEYRAKSSGNPLVYEVERYGKVLYSDPKPEEEVVKRLVELAEEYYGYSLKCVQQLMYRPAIDLGQNAIELLLKALILAKGEALPRSHAGYTHKFGEAYVLRGEVGGDVIAKLYRALEMRNKAKYDPEYRPTEADANEVLQTYRELKEIARRAAKEEGRSAVSE
jgi:predicted nucleotidyltransferase